MQPDRLKYLKFTSGTVEAAAGSNTTILTQLELDASYRELAFTLENEEAATALDAFILQVQIFPGGDWVTWISDWSTENDTYLFRATATLNTLAAATVAGAHVVLPPCNGIRFLASGNAATADVTVKGTFGRI